MGVTRELDSGDGTFTVNVREQTAAALLRVDTIIRGASNG